MRKRRFLLTCLCLLVLMSQQLVVTANSPLGYTYTYDYWREPRPSPDAYQVVMEMSGRDLGAGNFRNAESLFVRDGFIYVCDTGNNRIVVLTKADNRLVYSHAIDGFMNQSEADGFSAPHDVFVDDHGHLYVADTNNQRIVHLDQDLNLVKIIVKPEDETVDEASDFLPTKLLADTGGRIIALVRNYNKGFLQFKSDGDFAGYIGANEVKVNLIDYFWKRIASREQLEQMAQFVPTEYNNLAFDKDGFIYATTSVFNEYELLSDQAMPIRKLNAMGMDILVKNGNEPPVGDLTWDSAAGINGPSKFFDITVLDNGLYYALDRTRGRIFGYDTQGNLLYAFGGIGNKEGYFRYPTAIDHMGTDLIVLDGRTGNLTVFGLALYGERINQAIAAYEAGDYDQSAVYWEAVLRYNGNMDLAYKGIGRAYIRQERYEEAMGYFELIYDTTNYSKAFKLYRKQWIEDHIGWLLGGVALLLMVPYVVSGIKKIKREVEAA